MECEGVNWVRVAQKSDHGGFMVKTVMGTHDFETKKVRIFLKG
jgi:hypothetical protein